MADDRNARVVLSADVSQYQQQMAIAAQNTQQLAGSIDSAKTAHEGLMKSAAIGLGNFSKNIRAFQTGMSSITATLQKQMSTIEGVFGSRTVSGKSVPGTAREVENMRSGIKKLTGELPVARGEIVQLMTSISKMGVTSSDTINGLTANFLKLSAATGENSSGLAQGMIGLSRQMGTIRPEQRNADGTPVRGSENAFNSNVQTNTRMNDSLNSLSANAGVSAQGILDFSQQIAPAGRSAGMSQAEVMGTSTAFIAGGADGGFAASAFQTILNEISMMRSTNSEQLGKYSAALGVTGQELEKLSPFDIAKQIIQIIGSGPEGIAKANMMGFDGPRMMKALQAVNAAGGIEKFTNDAAMSYGSGSTEAGAKAASSGLFDELEKLKEKFTDIGDSIGSTVLPIFQTLAKATNMLVSPFKALGDWLGVFTGILGSITKLGSTLLHLMSAAGTLALIATLSKTGFAQNFQEGRKAKEAAAIYNKEHGLVKGDAGFKTGKDFTPGNRQRLADAENKRHDYKPGDANYRTAKDFEHMPDQRGRIDRAGGALGRLTGPDPFKKVREWRPGRTGSHYAVNAVADLMGMYMGATTQFTGASAVVNPQDRGHFNADDPWNRGRVFTKLRDAEGNKMPGVFQNLAHGWGVGLGKRSMLSVGAPGGLNETVYEAQERVTKLNQERLKEQEAKIQERRKNSIDKLQEDLKKELKRDSKKKNYTWETQDQARQKIDETNQKIDDINNNYNKEEQARRKARGVEVAKALKSTNAVDRDLHAGKISAEEARAKKAAIQYDLSKNFVDAKKGGIGGWAERSGPRDGETLSQLMRRRITEEGGLRQSTMKLSVAMARASASALALAGGFAAAKAATVVGRVGGAIGHGISNVASGAMGILGGPAGIMMTAAGAAWKLTKDLQQAAVVRGTINNDRRQIMTEDSYNLQTKYNSALGESVVSLANFKQGLDASKPASDQNSVANTLNDPTLSDRGRTKSEFTDERVKDIKTEQDALAFLTGMGPMSPNTAALAMMDLYKSRNFNDEKMDRIKAEYLARTQGGKAGSSTFQDTSSEMTTKLGQTLGGANPMRMAERSGGFKAMIGGQVQRSLNNELNSGNGGGGWGDILMSSGNAIIGKGGLLSPIPGVDEGREWLARTAGSVAQSAMAEDPRFQHSVGITYGNMVSTAEAKANETDLTSLKATGGRQVDQKTVKQLLLVQELTERMGKLAEEKNQALRDGGKGSDYANTKQAELMLLKDSAEQAGLSLGDRTVDKIAIDKFDPNNNEKSYTQQFRDAFLKGSKVGAYSLQDTARDLGIEQSDSAKKWAKKDLKPAEVLNEVQRSMKLIKLVGDARTLIEKDKGLQRVLSDSDMNPVALTQSIEKLATSGASYEDLKAMGYTRSPGSSSQQVLFAAAEQKQASRSEMAPTLSMPGRLQETADKANEAVSAFERDNQGIDAVKQSKQEIKSQLISLVSALQDFAKSKEREAEDFNQSRIDSANAFHLQMQYGEEDYQRQMMYSEQDFYRQRAHGQDEFQIQMTRSKEDYLRQEKRMIEDSAKSIYNIYARVQAQHTASADTIIENLKDQNERIGKQAAQLEQAKKLGLTQQAIDTMGLADPDKQQQLDEFIQDAIRDPSVIKKINDLIAKRGTKTKELVGGEDNIQLRRQREDFNRSIKNTLADQKRALDWGYKEYKRQTDRTDKAHKISIGRQVASYMLGISIQDRERGKMLRRMDKDFLDANRRNSMSITQLFDEAAKLTNKTLGKGGDALTKVLDNIRLAYERVMRTLRTTPRKIGGKVPGGIMAGGTVSGVASGGSSNETARNVLDWIRNLPSNARDWIRRNWHFAQGGLVTGPGTKTSDSIPIAASRGEYVVRAASVDKYGVQFMDAINKGEVSRKSSGGATTQKMRDKWGWLDSGDRGSRAPDGKYYGGWGGPSWGDYWAKHPGQWALKKAGLDWEHGGPKNSRIIEQANQLAALDKLNRSKRTIIEDVIRSMNVANKGITGAYAKQVTNNYNNTTNFSGEITIKSNSPTDMARQLQQMKRSRSMRGLPNIGA